MYSSAQIALKYFRYQLASASKKGHGVHSPFVYDFIKNVLNDTRTFDCFAYIESVRRELENNETAIEVPDFGAGSRLQLHHKRKISTIAKSSLKPKKFSRLLFNIVHYYKPQTIIELGTSFGITTSYLSFANPAAIVTTMEGAPAIASIAQQNFKDLQLNNITVVQGDFAETFSSAIKKFPVVDFAFIDGNHRKQPTIDYFTQLLAKANSSSIFIFDDIHWSREMENAWQEIIQHEAITLSIDLFFIGIIFFRKEQKIKQHFTIRF